MEPVEYISYNKPSLRKLCKVPKHLINKTLQAWELSGKHHTDDENRGFILLSNIIKYNRIGTNQATPNVQMVKLCQFLFRHFHINENEIL